LPGTVKKNSEIALRGRKSSPSLATRRPAGPRTAWKVEVHKGSERAPRPRRLVTPL